MEKEVIKLMGVDGYSNLRVQTKYDEESNTVFHKFGYTVNSGTFHVIGLWAEVIPGSPQFLYGNTHDNDDLQEGECKSTFTTCWKSFGTLDELIRRYKTPARKQRRSKK